MLKKEIFKYIERELYDYHDSLRQIELIRSNIIQQSEFDENPNENIGASRINSNVSTVELAVSRLQTDKRLSHLVTVVEAITNVYNGSDESTKKLIELKYWTKPQQFNWYGIASKSNVSIKTAQRRRDKFIKKIAEKIGCA